MNLKETIATMKSVVDFKVASLPYKVAPGKIEDTIFTRLMSSSKEKKILPKEESLIREAIGWSVANGQPINLSIFWGLGGQARSCFKIKDWSVNLPRLGDIWGLNWFDFLNRKIAQVYSPGINLVLVDETPTLKLLGWTAEEIEVRKDVLKKFLPGKFVQVMDMPDFVLPKREVITNPAQILAILTSIEDVDHDLQVRVASELYNHSTKDWGDIEKMAGAEEWARIGEIVKKMQLYSIARKEARWVENFVFKEQPFIDGCLTQRRRWCPDIWGMALPYHGGALLDNGEKNRFSIKIIPEHRLVLEGRTPVKVDVREFQEFSGTPLPWEGEVTLYWN